MFFAITFNRCSNSLSACEYIERIRRNKSGLDGVRFGLTTWKAANRPRAAAVNKTSSAISDPSSRSSWTAHLRESTSGASSPPVRSLLSTKSSPAPPASPSPSKSPYVLRTDRLLGEFGLPPRIRCQRSAAESSCSTRTCSENLNRSSERVNDCGSIFRTSKPGNTRAISARAI